MEHAAIQYEEQPFDLHLAAEDEDWHEPPADEHGAVWVDVYLFPRYEEGPSYPKKYRIIMHNCNFVYQEHSALVDLCPIEGHALEKWSYGGGWIPVVPWEKYPVINRCENEFIILRVANHPEGTNRHCIGLKEMVDVLNVTLWGRGLRAPMAILPDDLCPRDEANYLDLPVRCKCGRQYLQKGRALVNGDTLCPVGFEQGCRP